VSDKNDFSTIKSRCKIKTIGPNLSIYCANVCSITKNQLLRRLKIQTIIGNAQPDIVILLETNLIDNWNPFPALYSAFRTQDDPNCGVLILIKSQLSPTLLASWSNKSLCLEISKLNLIVIGLYTPKLEDVSLGLNLLKTWTNGRRWIAFSDNENHVSEFANIGTFKYIPRFSRNIGKRYSSTDAIYGNISIYQKCLSTQISDHFFLTCMVDPGANVYIQTKRSYKRKHILHYATLPKSNLRREILQYWPFSPMSTLLQNRVPKTKSKIMIWVPKISSEATIDEMKEYYKQYWKKTESFILNCIVNNKMKKLAEIARFLSGYNSNKKSLKGTTTDSGKQVTGTEATQIFLDFYKKLFSSDSKPLKMVNAISTFNHFNNPNSTFRKTESNFNLKPENSDSTKPSITKTEPNFKLSSPNSISIKPDTPNSISTIVNPKPITTVTFSDLNLISTFANSNSKPISTFNNSNSISTFTSTVTESTNLNPKLTKPAKLKIGKHKAMGIDLFPDELMQDQEIIRKLNSWAVRKLNGEEIEPIYSTGKLILLNKTNLEFPQPFQTRPIVLLSAVRKYLELLWYNKYKALLWARIGIWQIGFRPKHSTQENIVKLNQWLLQNRRGGIGVFVDVYKAFDSVLRMQVLEEVSKCNIDQCGLKVLYNLLKKMKLQYEKLEIDYKCGVPQGSVISPVLFNLVYEKLLREANDFGWFILAFADDLFIGVKSIKDYEKLVKWLDEWPKKTNLKVNCDKTKEFRWGRFSDSKGKFEKVEKYVYLGVEVVPINIIKTAKRRCRDAINQSLKVARIIKGSNPRANYFVILWWFVSSLLYKTIHGVACKFYAIDYIVTHAVKKIRKFANVPPRMSNKMLEEFFGFHIKQTILQTLAKVNLSTSAISKYQISTISLSNPISITSNSINRSATIWNKIITINPITPTMFTAWLCPFIAKGKKYKLNCKICKNPISFLHLEKHNLISSSTANFIKEVSKGSIHKAVDLLSSDIDKAKFKLHLILNEAVIKWNLIFTKLSYCDHRVS